MRTAALSRGFAFCSFASGISFSSQFAMQKRRVRFPPRFLLESATAGSGSQNQEKRS